MNIFKISLKNVLFRPYSAALTIILFAVGVALTSFLLLVGNALDEGFKKNIKGIDMVVGAKGSPLQLILASVYHIDNPTGNISKEEADKLARHPLVKESVQLSFGDTYKGRRIVGTSPEYLNWYQAKLSQGDTWDKPFESVLGADVAREFGLQLGDNFYSAHGSDANAEIHGDHPFTVTGILEENGSVLDQLILTSPESIWEVHGSHGDSAEKEITSMLIKFKSKMAMISLPRMVNEKTSMQSALPSIEVNRLFELFGVGISTLQIIAFSLMILGGISVFVSLYSSLKDRAYEMALIRSLGAGKSSLFFMILIESLILGVVGTIIGIIIAHGSLKVLEVFTDANLGIHVRLWEFAPGEGLLVLAALLLSLIAAIIPAWSIMKIDVSKVLSEYAN
jgi:putative ABC transport system permease protein